MKIRYDREEDILIIEAAHEGVIDHAEHTGPFIAHFNRDGQLLLLEILDASEFISSVVRIAVRGQEQELPLTVA